MYSIGVGTLQAYVRGFTHSPFIHHFGRAEYDVRKPVLPDDKRRKAQAVVDRLNSNEITEEEARAELDMIW